MGGRPFRVLPLRAVVPLQGFNESRKLLPTRKGVQKETMNKVVCFDNGTQDNMAAVFHRIYDAIAQVSTAEAQTYLQRVLRGAATIEEYVANCSYSAYPLKQIVYATPKWLEIVFEAGDNEWVCDGEMQGLDADDFYDDYDAIQAFCEENHRKYEEGKEAWAQHYAAKKASLPRELDTRDLERVQEIFRGNLMFHLEAGGSTLQGLGDFDQIIRSINEQIRSGEACMIVLIDWIEESEYLGTIDLLKRDRSTLVIQGVDVQAARKIRRHLISDLREALATFYTLVDTPAQWEELEQ